MVAGAMWLVVSGRSGSWGVLSCRCGYGGGVPTEVSPVYAGVWPELKTLSRLAAPVVLAQVGMMAMGVVDVVMVAPLGEQELASITLGHTWSFGLLVFVLGVSVGLDPFFSQAFGSGQPGLAWRSMAKGLHILCVFAIPVVVLHGFDAWLRISLALKLK